MAEVYGPKNYSMDGGDTLVIGGKLVILPEAAIEGLAAEDHPASTPRPTVNNSTATSAAALRTDLNELIAALRTAGILAPIGGEAP